MPLTDANDIRGFSRMVHAVDSMTSKASTVGIVVALVAVGLVALAITGLSNSAQSVFATVIAAVTVVMVFVIQHTQNRQQLALQIKLDELLRAIPQADDRFVHVEASTAEELEALEHRHIETHNAVRANDGTDRDDAREPHHSTRPW
jgi:low affinity Fe/Cu permease